MHYRSAGPSNNRRRWIDHGVVPGAGSPAERRSLATGEAHVPPLLWWLKPTVYDDPVAPIQTPDGTQSFTRSPIAARFGARGRNVGQLPITEAQSEVCILEIVGR